MRLKLNPPQKKIEIAKCQLTCKRQFLIIPKARPIRFTESLQRKKVMLQNQPALNTLNMKQISNMLQYTITDSCKILHVQKLRLQLIDREANKVKKTYHLSLYWKCLTDIVGELNYSNVKIYLSSNSNIMIITIQQVVLTSQHVFQI